MTNTITISKDDSIYALTEFIAKTKDPTRPYTTGINVSNGIASATDTRALMQAPTSLDDGFYAVAAKGVITPISVSWVYPNIESPSVKISHDNPHKTYEYTTTKKMDAHTIGMHQSDLIRQLAKADTTVNHYYLKFLPHGNYTVYAFDKSDAPVEFSSDTVKAWIKPYVIN